MTALFVVSAREAEGKTAIAAGLARRFAGEGKKVAFLKPAVGAKNGADPDVLFMKKMLALTEPVEALSPQAKGVAGAYSQVSSGKDIVIVEGRCGLTQKDDLSKTAYEIVSALKAKVVVVEGYSVSGFSTAVADSYKGFGKNLLGVILNRVPVSQLKCVTDEVVPHFKEARINVLGMLPEDRALMTFTVGELAESIQGEILNSPEKSCELVENFMTGALSVDSGLEYFARKANKAVLVRADRPDMQLAALETPTKCLVISGDKVPIYSVRYRAENRGVPIVHTKKDLKSVIADLEAALSQARFTEERKLGKLSEILGQRLDFGALAKGLVG